MIIFNDILPLIYDFDTIEVRAGEGRNLPKYVTIYTGNAMDCYISDHFYVESIANMYNSIRIYCRKVDDNENMG